MCFVVIFSRVLGIAPSRVLCRDRLSVGGLKDLTLGRVVSEELLNQVDVGEKHTAAAVAGKSQFVERLTVDDHRQSLFPKYSKRGIPHTLQSCPRHYRGQST